MTEKPTVMTHKPMRIVLIREEPEAHLNRWYVVYVQPTLLEPVAVICL